MAKTKKTKLPPKVVEYLEKAGINHEILEHRTIYTAIDAAATMRKKLGEIAKTLLVKADKDYYLVLLPADNNLDFKKLGKCISTQTDKNVKTIKIPGEKIMENVLKVKAGAMSAFGNLHKIPVVMDKGLAKAKKAVFSSGSFNHSIEMGVKDFVKLENAILGSFGIKKKVKTQPKAKPKKQPAKKKSAIKKKPVAKKKVAKKKKK